MVVLGLKTVLAPIGFPVGFGSWTVVAYPVINERAILLRLKLFQGFQAEASQKALQASQMFSPMGNGALSVAAVF
jgi:hypothetical protein